MEIQAEGRNVNRAEEMGREIGKKDIRILLQGPGPHFTAAVAALYSITT